MAQAFLLDEQDACARNEFAEFIEVPFDFSRERAVFNRVRAPTLSIFDEQPHVANRSRAETSLGGLARQFGTIEEGSAHHVRLDNLVRSIFVGDDGDEAVPQQLTEKGAHGLFVESLSRRFA